MKRKILQKIGDFIITKAKKALENSEYELVKLYCDAGVWLDNISINYFDIYLD